MKKVTFISLLILIIVGGVYLFQKRASDTKPEFSGGKVAKETKSLEDNVKSVEDEMQDIMDNIALLAKDFDPFIPFSVKRIWVQDQASFYIEYQNQKGTLAQLLVVKEDGRFKGVGYFLPSESGWVLQAGGGDLVGPNALLYEKDEKGEWVRKN